MANQTITLDLDVSQTQNGLQAVTGALGGLDKVLTSLGQKLTAVLATGALSRYLTDAVKAAGKLDKEFLVMRLALGKLRVAIGDALTPIAQIMLPVINDMIFGAIRFVRSVGRIIRGVLGIKESTDDAADAQDRLTQSAEKAKASLADFDRIDRLSSTEQADAAVSRPNNYKPDLQEYLIINTIKSMLAPLQSIDLTPLRQSLESLKTALEPLKQELFVGLMWGWKNVLVPMSQWTVEDLLPAFLDTLSVAIQTLIHTVNACRPALAYLWEEFLKPAAQWTGQAILKGLEQLRLKLLEVGAWMQENEVSVAQLLSWAGAAVELFSQFNGTLGDFTEKGQQSAGTADIFGSALNALQSPFTLVNGLVVAMTGAVILLIANWDKVADAAERAWKGTRDAWSTAWSWFQGLVINPIYNGFRGLINGIIGFFNGLITGAMAGVNAIVKAMNKLSFSVPDWIPGIGGEKFGFQLKLVDTPHIPYLAKGAVLPANKPFLAMVGDQRHGTNVEAPLATIQEAVATVMEDMIASNLAGQESIVAVLRQILEAVLGIRIGDAELCHAVDRYRSKMAVVNGGLF